MPQTFLDDTLDDFEAQFGLKGLRGQVVHWLPGELWVRVLVPGCPTPAMYDLAQAIELDYDDLGLTVRVSVQSADSWSERLRTWLKGWRKPPGPGSISRS